jgi:hypothetical protein
MSRSWVTASDDWFWPQTQFGRHQGRTVTFRSVKARELGTSPPVRGDVSAQSRSNRSTKTLLRPTICKRYMMRGTTSTRSRGCPQHQVAVSTPFNSHAAASDCRRQRSESGPVRSRLASVMLVGQAILGARNKQLRVLGDQVARLRVIEE